MAADSVGRIGLDLVVNQNGFNRQMAGIQNLAKKAGLALAAAFSVKKLVDFGAQCIELGSDLAEVQNVVDVTFPRMSAQVDKFAKDAAASFGLSETMAKKFTGTFGAMAKAFGFNEQAAYEMSTALTGLAGDVASFYNISQDEAYTKLKSVFTGETETLKDLGIVMTQNALDAYAMANGYGKVTAKMSEAEKVALRYKFVQEQLTLASGDFVRTSDGWANQVRVLKLQFDSLKSTIGQGLINAFTPVLQVINAVIGRLQTLADYFKALTAALFGDRTGGSGGALDGAGDASGDIADNMGSAAGSAKEMNKQLAKFDELNNLTSSKGGAGSGGSGSSVPDFGDISIEDVQKQADALSDKLINAFKSGDFEAVGEYIGAAITRSLEKIDWDQAYSAARNFGTGLAQFLNGLISPELFGTVGATIASGLNTALYGALAFAQTFDWTDFGESIASGINGMFLTFDFAALGLTVSLFVIGLLSTIIAALEKVEWYWIGQKIGSFLEALDWLTILQKTGEAIVLGIGGAIGLYLGSLNVAPLETAIITGIVAFKFRGVGKAIATAIGTALATGITLDNLMLVIQGFSANINSAAFVILWNEVIDKFQDFIRDHFGQEVNDAMGEALWVIVGAAGGAALGGPIGALIGAGIAAAIDTFAMKGEQINKFWKKIGENLFNWNVASGLWDSAKEFFDMAFKSDSLGDIGMNIIEGIINGMAAAVVWVLEPIGDLFYEIGKWLKDIFGIHSPAKKMEPYGKNILLGIIEGFKNTFSEWTTTLNNWYNNYVAPWFTAQKWSELYNTIKTQLSTKWDEAEAEWDTKIQSWWNTKVTPWFTLDKWKSAMSKVPDAFRDTFGAAVTAAIGKLNGLIDWVNDHLKIEIPGLDNPITGEPIFEGISHQLFMIPHIPALANGGFVKANTPQLAMIGDNRRYGEIVAPEDKMQEMVDKAVARSVQYATAAPGKNGLTEETLYRVLRRALDETKLRALVDSRENYRSVIEEDKKHQIRTKKSAFSV